MKVNYAALLCLAFGNGLGSYLFSNNHSGDISYAFTSFANVLVFVLAYLFLVRYVYND